MDWKFQSTRPVKDATGPSYCRSADPAVSIHASREGRDADAVSTHSKIYSFNPRVP